MLTKTQLDAIRAREAAATKGPWEVDPSNTGTHWNVETADGEISIALAQQLVGEGFRSKQPQRVKNAQFIASSRSDIPALLETVGELKTALKAMVELYDSEVHDEYNGTEMLDKFLADADFARPLIAEEPPKAGEGE